MERERDELFEGHAAMTELCARRTLERDAIGLELNKTKILLDLIRISLGAADNEDALQIATGLRATNAPDQR
jgi:hypothetical protein